MKIVASTRIKFVDDYRVKVSEKLEEYCQPRFNRHRQRENVDHQRRRARTVHAVIGRFTLVDWEAVKAAYDSRCAYCGRDDVPLTQDHVIPLSKGGAHTKENIVPACRPCNSRKGNRLSATPSSQSVVTGL